MPPNHFDPTIQTVQTEHRLNLAHFWDIKPGSKVLEIGCGQGDTTAVLAYLVGEHGFVHGIDIASPEYGSPITLGDSIQFLKDSPLGNRIQVDFETNVLLSAVEFPESSFDYVVLSHCSWYLSSPEELRNILKKIRKWGTTLCFAEWDTRIQSSEQQAHFLAVLIQAQYECYKESSLSNVRTLFTPKDIQQIAESAGWKISAETVINSSNLQDGKWEVDYVATSYQEELQNFEGLPSKMEALIQSEIKLLEAALEQDDIQSLSTCAFIAK